MRPSIGSPSEMALSQVAIRRRIAYYYDSTDEFGQSFPVSKLESVLRDIRDEMAVHRAVLTPPIAVGEGSAAYNYAMTCLSVLRAVDAQVQDALAFEAHAAMVASETRRKRVFDGDADLESAFKRVRL